eukprot:6184200-Pleurochrysis_carterae.AAC.1
MRISHLKKVCDGFEGVERLRGLAQLEGSGALLATPLEVAPLHDAALAALDVLHLEGEGAEVRNLDQSALNLLGVVRVCAKGAYPLALLCRVAAEVQLAALRKSA